MSSLTSAVNTTVATSVCFGNTVFLTIAALSERQVADRDIPSWIAIQGRNPASRYSGNVMPGGSPVNGIRRTTENTKV